MYKQLFFASITVNIILIAIVLFPQIINKNAINDQFKSPHPQDRYDKKISSDDYNEISGEVKRILDEVTLSWDINTVKENLSDKSMNSLKNGDLERLIALFKPLGKTLRIEKLQVLNSVEDPGLKIVRMNCKFENGEGVVRLGLVNENSKWLLAGINISSDSLLKQN